MDRTGVEARGSVPRCGLPPRICIVGTDGSGKSTLVARVRARWQASLGRPVLPLSLWDAVRARARDGPRGFAAERTDLARRLETMSPRCRFELILEGWTKALQLARKGPGPGEPATAPWVIDGFWYKYAASELAMGLPRTAMSEALAAAPLSLGEQARFFFLELPPEIAAQRKQRFTAYECGYRGDRGREAFVAFQQEARKHLVSLLAPLDPVPLDARLPVEHLTRAILDEVSVLRNPIKKIAS